ncbi:hypothetical protein NHQ30_001682 [Ciborinia camelliae]|nr:hypothetical protein NHQ30_001682 [Ciborinia camelliae]
MSETPTTPRITSSYLNSFTSRTVRMVGKVTQLRGDQATIDCDGAVTVLLGRLTDDPPTARTDFLAMNALVDANHRYKEIWYKDN